MLLLSQDKIIRERSNRLDIGRPKNQSREFLIPKFCLDSDLHSGFYFGVTDLFLISLLGFQCKMLILNYHNYVIARKCEPLGCLTLNQGCP